MKPGDEKIESWGEVLRLMNDSQEGSTLQQLKDVYGLNGFRVKGVVLEFDPTVPKETQEDIDRRYFWLKEKREKMRQSLGGASEPR